MSFGPTWLWALLAAVWLADAHRLRRRLSGLERLEPSDEPVSDDHVFICAPGVELDEPTRRAASAHARRRGLECLDLVPERLPTARLLGLLQLVDPVTYRNDKVAKGRTAGHAVLASRALLNRAGVDPAQRPNARAFLRLGARLKQYAVETKAFALAPGLAPAEEDVSARRSVLEALFGDLLPPVLLVQLALLATAAAGPVASPIVGTVALLAFQLQPLLITAGLPVRPADRVPWLLLRVPREALEAVLLLFGAGRERDAADPVEAKRAAYEARLAGGLERLFDPRREDCPLCGGRALRVHLRTRDLLQHKPGTFTIERCDGCGHVFQNPRLSLEGLGYYYGDFYDGLGEDGLEAVFAYSADPYRSRAGMVREHGRPKRWLDVGTGHGHFPLIAREVFPDTTFVGLDLSESVEEAQRRGWITAHHRGLFPELAPTLAAQGERFDAVSMSHYLEHTRDPRAELAAAATVLAPGGLLFVEVPDPGSPLGALLGRWWIPHFQPQHQHFVSVAAMERLLREAGLEPLAWHRDQAHQPVDFLFAAMLLLGALSPPRAPWLPKRGPLGTAWNRLVWWGGAPLLVLGTLLDRLADPLVRRAGWSNTYRVVARRPA